MAKNDLSSSWKWKNYSFTYMTNDTSDHFYLTRRQNLNKSKKEFKVFMAPTIHFQLF